MHARLLPLLALSLIACTRNTPEPTPEPWPDSMKGWEVYSYRLEDEAALRWTILTGTNRTKRAEEVYGTTPIERPNGARGTGSPALEAELARFSPGSFVGWNLHPPTLPAGIAIAWPPDEVLARIEARAREESVELHFANRHSERGANRGGG